MRYGYAFTWLTGKVAWARKRRGFVESLLALALLLVGIWLLGSVSINLLAMP